MDAQDLITGVRWHLLQAIAQRPQTGAELALRVGTSAANVSQHLKLLELSGIITKERANGKSSCYKLPRDSALITVLCEQPYRITTPLNGVRQAELKLLFQDTEKAKYTRRFLLEYEHLALTFHSFGMLINDDVHIHLLVLAPAVESLRSEYSNLHVGDRKVIIWSHTPAEFTAGIQRKDSYFTKLLQTLEILYDTENTLTQLKEAHSE